MLYKSVGTIAITTLVACNSGGSELSSNANSRASVSGVALSSVVAGDTEIEFLLTSATSRPVDVELVISRDSGATWQSGTVRQGAVTGLAASPDGVRHELVWDSIADLGFRGLEEEVVVQVRVTNNDPQIGRVGVAYSEVEPPTASAAVQNVETAARRIDNHMLYFGAFDADQVAIAETHDLVVLAPCQPTVTRELIAEIQDGVDPSDPLDDVLVIGLVNVGQDVRTAGLSDTDLLADPRFVGDATGPRVDPRGPGASGQSLAGLDPLGLPSISTGYASWYLDDNSVDALGFGDGLPDRNAETGSCFVNLGDPQWFDALDGMTCDGVDGVNGIRETLSLDFGRGYGCDGIFLGAVDTVAPNIFTYSGSPVQSEFEWTAPGYLDFVRRLRLEYPEKLIAQNRGLFFFDPRFPHYKFSPREQIDYLTFESYRLDRSSAQDFNPFFAADNRFNVMPKLVAEADRVDGFQVLSLGYAEGPSVEKETLIGDSTVGRTTLLEDILQAHELAGFRHYLTDSSGSLVNSFVRDNVDFDDSEPPIWTSTFNANAGDFLNLPSRPTSRVGVQEIVTGIESAIVRWDVATDLNPVTYVAFVGDERFDFASDNPFEGARRLELRPEVGLGYDSGTGPAVYPYESTIAGLQSGEHWICIRAVDSAGNMDENQVQLPVLVEPEPIEIQIDGDTSDFEQVPVIGTDRELRTPSAGPDWKEIKVTNDDEFLYIFFTSFDEFQLDGGTASSSSQTSVLIDIDDNPFTGVNLVGRLGAELTVVGNRLAELSSYRFSSGQIQLFGTVLQTIAAAPLTPTRELEMAIPLSVLDEYAGKPVTEIRLLFLSLDNRDVAPSKDHHAYTVARDDD